MFIYGCNWRNFEDPLNFNGIFDCRLATRKPLIFQDDMDFEGNFWFISLQYYEILKILTTSVI